MELREGVFMKKIILGVIIGVLLSTTAFAATLTVSTVSYKVFVDGKEVTSEKINYNGRTYLEMRQVAELLGASVEWDGKKADVYSKDYTPPLPDMNVREVKVFVNGEEVLPPHETIKFYAYIKDGELMVNSFIIEMIPNLADSSGEKHIYKYYGSYLTIYRGTNKYETPREKKTAKVGSEFVNGMYYFQASLFNTELRGLSIKLEEDTVKITATNP